MVVLAVYGVRVNGRWCPELGDLMEPKPVKSLVAFAAVRDGAIVSNTIRNVRRLSSAAIANRFPDGWPEAKRRGYRIIKVRIEPLEE